MIVLAHLSDTHFDGTDAARQRNIRVMEYLNGLSRPVDAIVATGDIADDGRAEEYEEAAKTLVSPQPLFHCPGNHDRRGPYRRVLLGEEPGDEPINRVHRAGGAVFAMCDSMIPAPEGERIDEGRLADATLAWLDGVLADAREAPVFVCFHHPPVELHIPVMDGMRQFGADRLAAVLARHGNVAAVLVGHAHTPAATVFAGVPLLVAPGVASTIRLPWEHGRFIDRSFPPAVAFHILGDDGRLTTHYRLVV